MTGMSPWLALVSVLALAFGALGVFIILFPGPGSALFGISADSQAALSYVRALGIRDIALCLWMLALSRLSPTATRLLLGFGVVIPVGDFLIVLFEQGTERPLSLVLHALSGLCLAALAAWPQRRGPSA